MSTVKRKVISASGSSEVMLRSKDGVFSKSRIWVEDENFYGTKQKESPEAYLIIGFDTEFKTPSDPVTKDDIESGLAKYKVLSYQIDCEIFDPAQPDARSWNGICYPEDGKRLTLADVLTFAFWRGIQTGSVRKLPLRIYLVGHFTRADIPAFADFQTLTELISSVRNTFISIGNSVAVKFSFSENVSATLSVLIRDTWLLTPASSKSLLTLGKLVGVDKVELDADPLKEQFYKENMDLLLRDNPELFERYAINDATICTRYLSQIIGQYYELLGKRSVPATLSGIGVDLLLKEWEASPNLTANAVLGKETIRIKRYEKKLGYYAPKDLNVPIAEVSLYNDLVTECYHGGRNEQFWFGPCFEDDWIDYDLAGAYPTAMALIGLPDWANLHPSTKLDDFALDRLSFALIDFEFPKRVRFPTLPVRTAHGLVFPRKGTSYCAGPEIALAVTLGARVRIRHGVVVPSDPSVQVFAPFISGCIKRRNSYDPGTLRNLFWKELTNSTYGKTAQGLKLKRVYDLRERESKELPPSKITNPYFASYITSFVRAALGEIMNALDRSVNVFSCTTDGFLTNATADEIKVASAGPTSQLYRKSRFDLTGDDTMLEIKHRIRKPLGWRTRGQATLVPGTAAYGGDKNYVLAKGGIYTSRSLADVPSRNRYIVDLFLERTPTDEIEVPSKVSLRTMVEYDTDLVERVTKKHLSMEYDWKRRPSSIGMMVDPIHVAFDTLPWDTIEQFDNMREHWEAFAIADDRRCLKTLSDFRQLAVFVLSQSALGRDGSRYLKKMDPDTQRLRLCLCLAWRTSKGGLTKKVDGRTMEDFAAILTSFGIPCKRSDVENARGGFKPRNCPPTPAVLTSLTQLKSVFPSIRIEDFVVRNEGIDLTGILDHPWLVEFIPLLRSIKGPLSVGPGRRQLSPVDVLPRQGRTVGSSNLL